MTSKELFTEAYRRTLAATGATLQPDHFEECWRVLQGIGAGVFDAAATRLNASSKFLPKPSEWLDACKAIEGERYMERVREQDAAAEGHRNERTYHCLRCHDSGKEQGLRCTADHWCGICKRQGRHLYDHTFCVPCDCKDSNPVYQSYLAKMQTDTATYRQKSRKDAA